MDYLKAADRSWPALNRLMGGHARIYRATGGRIGHRLPGLPQMLLLDHVGAKSGAKRTSPLLYIRDGDDLVIVASKGGYPKNPAWYYNLVANPDTTVQLWDEVIPVRARVANGEERARLWTKAVELYPGYAEYQRRADREIPVVILQRLTSAAPQ
jgi:deazaflavin-dependent oxidoreductase (nitroreductase family)